MPDSSIDQIVEELRITVSRFYPGYGLLRNVRVTGHTPKTGHYVYDISADFDAGSQRLAAKIYRSGHGSLSPEAIARNEFEIMDAVYQRFEDRSLPGLSRPLGDFSRYTAIVTEKPAGLPLQSIIMKAALLPARSELDRVDDTASACGAWLRQFHEQTSLPARPFSADVLLEEVERVCASCRGSGLDDAAIALIRKGSRNALHHASESVPCSVVLNDFVPLNIAAGDGEVGVYDYSRMTLQGNSLDDIASFLASVEALEKYPFCKRHLIVTVQDAFCDGYRLEPQYEGIVRVLKMKFLLGMFAQGRNTRETAMRKKIMWANVMKRFIHNAAERSMTAA